MNYKKLSVFTFLFLMLSVSFVSASWGEEVQTFLTSAVDTIKPISKLLFGEVRAVGENGVMNILAFALVMLVIFGVLSPLSIFGNNQLINLGIAFIISVIGIRFMPVGFLQNLTTPSSALIATIVLIVPVVILFFITLKISNPGIRRVIWVVYGTLVIGLLFLNWQSAESNKIYWIYVLIAISCLILFWFDGTLNKWMNKASNARRIEGISQSNRNQLMAEMDRLQASLKTATNQTEIISIKNSIRQVQQALNGI